MTSETKADKTPAARFREMVEETAADINKLNANNLLFYKKLGSRVSVLLESPDRYGNRTVEMFCEELSKHSIAPVKASTVYAAVRVWNGIGAKGFDDAVKANMTWRNLQWLGTKSLSDDKRKEILDSIVTGQLSQLKAQEAVSAARAESGGGGGDGGGGGSSDGTSGGDTTQEEKKTHAQAARMLKNLPKLFDTTREKVTGYADAVQAVIDANDPEEIAEAKKQLEEFKEKFDSLKSFVEKESTAAEKKLQKFK
jgi:Spy/CpxP family protein refolding chaperone